MVITMEAEKQGDTIVDGCVCGGHYLDRDIRKVLSEKVTRADSLGEAGEVACKEGCCLQKQ